MSGQTPNLTDGQEACEKRFRNTGHWEGVPTLSLLGWTPLEKIKGAEKISQSGKS